MKIDDRVIVTFGDHTGLIGYINSFEGSNAVITTLEPEHLYGMVLSFDMAFLEKYTANEIKKEIERDNILQLPPVPSRFQHRHQLRIDGKSLELTHKELKELGLLIQGLLNE